MHCHAKVNPRYSQLHRWFPQKLCGLLHLLYNLIQFSFLERTDSGKSSFPWPLMEHINTTRHAAPIRVSFGTDAVRMKLNVTLIHFDEMPCVEILMVRKRNTFNMWMECVNNWRCPLTNHSIPPSNPPLPPPRKRHVLFQVGFEEEWVIPGLLTGFFFFALKKLRELKGPFSRIYQKEVLHECRGRK